MARNCFSAAALRAETQGTCCSTSVWEEGPLDCLSVLSDSPVVPDDEFVVQLVNSLTLSPLGLLLLL